MVHVGSEHSVSNMLSAHKWQLLVVILIGDEPCIPARNNAPLNYPKRGQLEAFLYSLQGQLST
jgi:hypothetical protein